MHLHRYVYGPNGQHAQEINKEINMVYEINHFHINLITDAGKRCIASTKGYA